MYAVRTQLSWTHLRSLMAVPNSLARQFYMEMCRIEHWSTRTWSSYSLDMLGLPDVFCESEQETAILNQIQSTRRGCLLLSKQLP